MPQFVFLDTNVFAGQQYNFGSTALRTFVPAAQAHGLTLLLPDPTEREIRRQIRERSDQALAALNEARRSAPFLAKWTHFPKKSFAPAADWDVRSIAEGEWQQFLKQFNVKKLDYTDADVAQVMRWYDVVKPPFGQGKKRKEFPDAFAVQLLEKFSSGNNCAIAVVSDDNDIKLSCGTRPKFLHFNSLPKLTELLLAGSAHIEALRASVLDDLELVKVELWKGAEALSYFHGDRKYELMRSDLETCEIEDIRIVAVGSNECTLACEALTEASHKLKWQEQSYDDEWVDESATVLDSGLIHATVKVKLDPKTQRITEVPYLDLEEGELEVTEAPRHR